MTRSDDGRETPLEDFGPLTLDAIRKLMESMLEKSEKKMEDIISAKISSSPTKAPSEEVDENGIPKVTLRPNPEASKVNSSQDTHVVNFLYNNAPNVQHPRINNVGAPPLVDSSHFTDWKASMKSHVCCSSMQLWRVIEQGYSPKDSNNLTSSEIIDKKLNALAMNMLCLL